MIKPTMTSDRLHHVVSRREKLYYLWQNPVIQVFLLYGLLSVIRALIVGQWDIAEAVLTPALMFVAANAMIAPARLRNLTFSAAKKECLRIPLLTALLFVIIHSLPFDSFRLTEATISLAYNITVGLVAFFLSSLIWVLAYIVKKIRS